MTHLEMIRFVKECYPEYGGQLYVNMTDCAKIFGISRTVMRNHIARNHIPWYRPAKEKIYNILEVLDSVQSTRWAQKPIDNPK